MSKPPHICIRCNLTIPHGERCVCQIEANRERNKRHDRNRPTASQRGYNFQWRKARSEWLHYHPFCNLCRGKANVVDHIQAHKGDKKLFWDKSNWQSLCTPCHNRTKQRLERKQ